MTLRRLAAAVVALWALPAAAVLGVRLHVALDHAHVAADGRSDGALLAQVVEHGHAHLGESAEHDHAVELTSAPPLRRGDHPGAVAPPQDAEAVVPEAGPPVAPVAARSAAPLPRARGPALLALLSVFRV